MADQLTLQITSLTQAIKTLDTHVTAVANGLGGVGPDVSTPGGVVLPSGGAAAAQQLAAIQAAQTPAGSVSPNSSQAGNPGTGNPQQQEQASINALTWESLGSMGGPLGAFQQRQYVASRYGSTMTNAGNALQYETDGNGNVQMMPDPNNPDGPQIPVPSQSGFGSTNVGQRLGAAANWAGDTLSGNAGKAALIGGGLSSAYLLGSDWTSKGVDLGYGTRQGIASYGQLGGSVASATAQGAALTAEEWALRRPGGVGSGIGSGGSLTGTDAEQAVNTLAGLGFSDQGNGQGGVGGLAAGDNSRLASQVVGPLMQQGVSAQGAADWTEALRNANDTIPSLTSSLGGMSQAAQAAKVTTDQYNTSLLEFAQNQVANGGTTGQAAQTGMDFTATTGMLPGVLATLQNNPVYQGLMMGQNGVLPSDIGNLTPGAQLQGVQSLLNLYGKGLGGLNTNKYENVGGVKVVSSYGNAAEAAQIAQMTGMTQSQVTRLMNETKGGNMNQMIDALNKVGSPDAGGGMGSGIWSILDKSNQWKTLSGGNKQKAEQAWNKGIAPDLKSILTPDELKKINSTSDVRTKASDLQKDLLGNQKNNPNNQIKGQVSVKIEASSWLKKMLKMSASGSVKLGGNSGGTAPNNVLNTVQADAMAANPGTERFGPGL